MDEEEWLTADDPASLLAFMRDEASDRKFRLFACGCCRLVWDRLTDGRSRSVVETVERRADGNASESELQLASQLAERAYGELRQYAAGRLTEARGKMRHFVTEAFEVSGAAEAAWMTASELPYIYPYPWMIDCGGGPFDGASILLSREGYDRVFRERGEVCRCVFGNPFRPAAFDPAWRSSDAMILARGIYDDRAFDRMPILADALQDAGCDSEELLNHLRAPDAPHVRGCWALDLVLGKE